VLIFAVKINDSLYAGGALIEWTADCRNIKLRVKLDKTSPEREFWADASVGSGNFIECMYAACCDMVPMICIEGNVSGDSIRVKYECLRREDGGRWEFVFVTRQTERQVGGVPSSTSPVFHPMRRNDPPLMGSKMQDSCSTLVARAAAILEELRL
jgi:hypothetical protein